MVSHRFLEFDLRTHRQHLHDPRTFRRESPYPGPRHNPQRQARTDKMERRKRSLHQLKRRIIEDSLVRKHNPYRGRHIDSCPDEELSPQPRRLGYHRQRQSLNIVVLVMHSILFIGGQKRNPILFIFSFSHFDQVMCSIRHSCFRKGKGTAPSKR